MNLKLDVHQIYRSLMGIGHGWGHSLFEGESPNDWISQSSWSPETGTIARLRNQTTPTVAALTQSIGMVYLGALSWRVFNDWIVKRRYPNPSVRQYQSLEALCSLLDVWWWLLWRDWWWILWLITAFEDICNWSLSKGKVNLTLICHLAALVMWCVLLHKSLMFACM